MAILYHYSKVEPQDIAQSLDSMFGSLDKHESVAFSRSSNSNLILIVSSADLFSELDDFIDSLATSHPCRFFLVASDPGFSRLQTEVAVRCHSLSSRQQVCSEVVRVSCPAQILAAVPELIRANLISGTETELLVWDGRVGQELADTVAGLADRIFFDSADFDERFSFLGELAEHSPNLVDLQWVRLSPWREELRTLFDSVNVRPLASCIRAIKLTASAPEQLILRRKQPACLLLVAGWFVNCLKLEVVAGGGDSYRAVDRDGRSVKLELHTSAGGSCSRLRGLSLDTCSEAREQVTVVLEGDRHLDVRVNLAQPFAFSRPFEDETRLGLLRRYFQIGDAKGNYYDVLRSAVEMSSWGEDLR